MHEHEHNHCDCCHSAPTDETLALLKYMLEHNKHHADELHELAHNLDGQAKELVHAAVIDIEKSNGNLQKALQILTKGE